MMCKDQTFASQFVGGRKASAPYMGNFVFADFQPMKCMIFVILKSAISENYDRSEKKLENHYL